LLNWLFSAEALQPKLLVQPFYWYVYDVIIKLRNCKKIHCLSKGILSQQRIRH